MDTPLLITSLYLTFGFVWSIVSLYLYKQENETRAPAIVIVVGLTLAWLPIMSYHILTKA